MTDANKLAESLRTMRSSARRHHDGAGGKVRWSVVLDAQWIGDLSDAADLVEKLAAALTPLANAAAPIEREMLTDADVQRAQEALYGADDPQVPSIRAARCDQLPCKPATAGVALEILG